MNWFPNLFWLFLEWALLVGLGVLTGLLIGWLFWRRRLGAQVDELEYKLDRESRERTTTAADHDHALAALKSKDDTISTLQGELDVQGQALLAVQPMSGSAVSQSKLATARINGLQTELSHKSALLAAADSGAVAEREQAQQQIARFGSELANARNELALSSQRSKQLDAELDASKHQIAQIQHQLATTMEQSGTLQGQLDRSADRVAELENELGSRSTNAANRQAELDTARERASEFERQITASNAQVRELENQLDSGIRQTAAVQRELDQVVANHASLHDELSASQERAAQLQATLDRSAAEAAKTSTDLVARDHRLAEVQKGLDARTTRIVELQRQLNATALTVTQLEQAAAERSAPPAEATVQARNLDYIDNLKPVVGIGQRMSGRLEKQGIVNYYQLATVPPEEIKRLAKRIGVRPHRIKKEKWIEQAVALHYKKHGEQIDLR